jgi:transcriptional regulator EpsA
LHLSTQEIEPPEFAAASVPAVGPDAAERAGTFKSLDPLELETLMLNLEASMRVHARPHFFNWTQGLLQSLIRHELLICVLRGGEPSALHADSFSMAATDPSLLCETYLRDASVAPALAKAWEERRFRPVVCEAGGAGPVAPGGFARELERLGATHLLAHGTHDANGAMTSFFILACAAGSIGPRQTYFIQLAVPFLHTAWLRTLANGRSKDLERMKPAIGSSITVREREILKWIYLGKSNIEIGTILSISPLTVKNHVQKILRKLDVLNRTQAVGKALALRILSA